MSPTQTLYGVLIGIGVLTAAGVVAAIVKGIQEMREDNRLRRRVQIRRRRHQIERIRRNARKRPWRVR